MEKKSLIEKFFQVGNSLQIEIATESEGKLVYQAKVSDLKNNQLLLMLPEKEESVEQIKPGAKINLVCQNEEEPDDYIFTTQIIKYVPGEQPLLILTRPSEIYSSTRRRFFRLDVTLPFSYFGQEELRGEVTNLSASGLFAVIEPNQHLKVDMTLPCRITLPNAAKPIMFVGKITRVQKKGRLQGIGLCFEYSNEDLQSKITKYLFQRQRQLINQNRNKTQP